MPSGREHAEQARKLGVDGKTALNVSRMLDFPPAPLKHKSIHNLNGLVTAFTLYGPPGLTAAAEHMLDDYLSEETRRYLKKVLKGNILERLLK